MSYSIIFETKIVRLSDGRILHLDRSGCNNDDAGRSRWDYTGSICSESDFVEKATSYQQNSVPYNNGGNFDLIIGRRCASFFDYGEHLLRMLGRAKGYQEFLQERTVMVSYCTAIEFVTPEEKVLPLEQFSKEYYRLLHDGVEFSYRRLMCCPNINNEQEIVRLIDEEKYLEFYVSPKKGSRGRKR